MPARTRLHVIALAATTAVLSVMSATSFFFGPDAEARSSAVPAEHSSTQR